MARGAQGGVHRVIPSLVTNLWQFAAGPNRLVLLRRMAPMLLAIGLATWLAAAPALAGTFLGQELRAAVDAQTFRRLFLIGHLLLGADLMARGVL